MATLVEIVSAGAASAQALASVVPLINGARSVIIEIDNSTGATLRRVRDHHEHGGFAVTPSSEIPPLHADVFGAQNSAGSIGTGTEGEVFYEGLGRGFRIFWVNPFLGENEIDANVHGGNLAPLRIVTTKGAGNTHAHMRYEVFPRSLTWDHAPPGDVSPVRVAAGTSPTSWYTTPENVQHIAFVGEDRKIHEVFFRIGGTQGWEHSTPGDVSPVRVAAGTSPTSWYTTPENVQHIAFVGEDRKIHQCFFFIGGFGGWQHEIPGDASPVNVAAGTSPTSWYTTPENVQHIAYVGDDHEIHELFFFVHVGGGHTWLHAIPSAGREKVAEGTSPTSWYTTAPTNAQHIAYVGATDRQIHELFFLIGGDNAWHESVPSAGREKAAAGTSPTSWYTTPENVQHIAYVGSNDRKIHECFFFIR
jgi:hypothetical protein